MGCLVDVNTTCIALIGTLFWRKNYNYPFFQPKTATKASNMTAFGIVPVYEVKAGRLCTCVSKYPG